MHDKFALIAARQRASRARDLLFLLLLAAILVFQVTALHAASTTLRASATGPEATPEARSAPLVIPAGDGGCIAPEDAPTQVAIEEVPPLIC